MLRDAVGSFVDDDAVMLADLAQLTPDPTALESLLTTLGYRPQGFGTGLYAPGDTGERSPVLLFPLHSRAGLAVRKRQLVGRQISRSSAIAAGLVALRSVEQRPPLLFLLESRPPPDGVAPERLVSLEGGVVPRIWRRCFGSFDALARIAGQPAHPGLPNTAINAIESAIPVMQALLHLKADLRLRTVHRGKSPDAPLQPRVTISAAHGGSRGSVLPVVFDILVNRRYDPAESFEASLAEMKSTISAALPRSLRLEVTVTAHDPPAPDPDAGHRSREERALAAGWGWPQVPFCSSSMLIPGATLLGGLERPDCDAEADDASTTLDEMTALARTIRALLLDG